MLTNYEIPLSKHLPPSFLKAAAFASGALASSGYPLWAAVGENSQGENETGKKPKKGSLADVQHIIVVMMENRSFDHLLGWLPGANGRQAGLSYKDRQGVFHPTHPLAPDFQGLGHPDPGPLSPCRLGGVRRRRLRRLAPCGHE